MCDCSADGTRCTSSLDCCGSWGASKCSGGVCVPGCRPVGDVCEWDDECCSFNCDATDHCAPPCVGSGTACTASSQCCDGMGCPAGSCTSACGTDYTSCTGGNDCCSGHACRAGECQLGYCGTGGQLCATQAECCDAASGGKNWVCKPYDAYIGTCSLSQPFEGCVTAADCVELIPFCGVLPTVGGGFQDATLPPAVPI